MPAKSITGRKAPSPTATTALPKAAAPTAPDTKLSAAFQAALGGGPKQTHLSFPGQVSVKTAERSFQGGRPNGKDTAGGPALSAGFDARRGHK